MLNLKQVFQIRISLQVSFAVRGPNEALAISGLVFWILELELGEVLRLESAHSLLGRLELIDRDVAGLDERRDGRRHLKFLNSSHVLEPFRQAGLLGDDDVLDGAPFIGELEAMLRKRPLEVGED